MAFLYLVAASSKRNREIFQLDRGFQEDLSKVRAVRAILPGTCPASLQSYVMEGLGISSISRHLPLRLVLEKGNEMIKATIRRQFTKTKA